MIFTLFMLTYRENKVKNSIIYFVWGLLDKGKKKKPFTK
ncbi:MAG: hypothetical protein FD167_3556 [bacterium]|nr:MAG: hypothetical protein FD167_3556 [bacterium]